jgi:hypothetical protein
MRRLVALLMISLLAGCGPGLTSETGDCLNVAGDWKLAFSDGCGRFDVGQAVSLTQTGCRFAGSLPGLGTIEGTLVNDTASIKITRDGACKGTLSGTATVGATEIDATYGGEETGTTGCCAHVLGKLTLTR